MDKVPELGRYREMLRQLRPTELYARGCKVENLDTLKGLTGLQWLDLSDSPALKNVDGLKGLTTLQTLDLWGCRALQNADVLKSLTALQKLYIGGCDKIPATALRELRAALPKTDITFPDGTMNPPQ